MKLFSELKGRLNNEGFQMDRSQRDSMMEVRDDSVVLTGCQHWY